MSDASPASIPPNIVQLTGPVFIGQVFNWGLLGALTVQSYIYYISFPKDRWLPKVLVFTVYVVELLQTVLATRDGMRNFGFGWGNLEDLNEVGWYWFSIPTMTALISCTVQVFYGWRIWILSHSIYIPVPIVLLSLVQCGAGIWTGVKSKNYQVFSVISRENGKPTIVWLGGTALCDVIIAVSMIYFLTKSRTGFRTTNVLLTKLVRLTIETGCVPAAFAVIELAMFLGYKEANYHLTPALSLSKLYSNSLLVLLNARVRVVGGRGGISTDVSDGTLSWAPESEPYKLSRFNRQRQEGNFDVIVTEETLTDTGREGSIGKSRKLNMV